MKPVIDVEGLQFLPARESDLDRICTLLWQADVRRYLCDDVIRPVSFILELLAESARGDADGLGLWTLHQSGGFIGLGGLRRTADASAQHPLMRDAIEPTVALHPSVWGRGLGRHCLRTLLRYAARELGLTHMGGTVDRPNQASHGMMRACGFEEIGHGPGPKYELVFYRRDLAEFGEQNAVRPH